jgi:uncharacterized protein YydD (DUF2326 family)
MNHLKAARARLDAHETNSATSAAVSFLRDRLNDRFPRFVYHDGVFESLDDRKKENLLTVIRRYAELGLQPIITLIDSDLPTRISDQPIFVGDEIVLTLNDENEQGRLFRMRAW